MNLCVICEADVEGVCEHCRIPLCGSCLVDHRIVRPCVPRAVRRRPANEQLAGLIEELEYCESLKRELQRRAMIYQCAAKERVALAQGLPFDAYYDLSYEAWGEVWREYTERQGA